MSFDITWKGSNPNIILNGNIEFEVIRRINDYLIGDIRFDKMSYQLWDFRNIKITHIKELDIKTISILDASASVWNKKMNIALIATEDYIIDLCEIYAKEMEKSSWEVKIFNNRKVALKWCIDN